MNPEVCLVASDLADLAALEEKVNALLPPQYHFCSEAVSPTSMGSAALKYGQDGRVAWNEIWTSFCDLAMAGGPPHRGTLLEAPTAEEVDAEPAGHQLVLEEILRGVRLTTKLPTSPGEDLGWVAVRCHDEAMAAWLLRAVMAENVRVRRHLDQVFVPAGPWFRLAKEVKNVVVAVAKTCHYWCSHLTDEQRATAGRLLLGEVELVEPVSREELRGRGEEYRGLAVRMGREVEETIGLPAMTNGAAGWLGVRCADEQTAGWFTRAAIAVDVLARREQEVLYVPVTAAGEAVERLRRLHRLWAVMSGFGRHQDGQKLL